MNNIDMDLGQIIKKFRLDRGLSIRELAKNAEITPSMLSQIERNLVNPSINTLKALSVELNVPMYRFFKADEVFTENIVVRKDHRKLWGNPNESVAYELLTPDVRGTIECCIMHVHSQKDSKEFHLSHSGEEVAYILTGKTDIQVDEVSYTLEAGDSIRIPPHAVHSWKNPYGEVCDVIFAVTPPSF